VLLLTLLQAVLQALVPGSASCGIRRLAEAAEWRQRSRVLLGCGAVPVGLQEAHEAGRLCSIPPGNWSRLQCKPGSGCRSSKAGTVAAAAAAAAAGSGVGAGARQLRLEWKFEWLGNTGGAAAVVTDRGIAQRAGAVIMLLSCLFRLLRGCLIGMPMSCLLLLGSTVSSSADCLECCRELEPVLPLSDSVCCFCIACVALLLRISAAASATAA